MEKTFEYKMPFLIICGYLGVYLFFILWAILGASSAEQSLTLIANSFKQTSLTEEAVGISRRWQYTTLLFMFTSPAVLLSILYSFYNLWKLTRNFSKSRWIIPENGQLLIRLALVLMFYMTHLKLLKIGSLLIGGSIKIEILIGGILGLIFNLQMIIGTLIFAVGKVLIYASEIKQENDLTV